MQNQDLTYDDGGRYMGRLIINHGKGEKANVIPKIIQHNSKPEIVFFANLKKIKLGDELLYEYS